MFFVAPVYCAQGRIPFVAKRRIPPPSLGGLENLPASPSPGTQAGLTLNSYMEPDAADNAPTGRQPNRSKKGAESAPFDVQCEIDSIVLNAPVADVYAYCSRFEELPRFITSLRVVHKIATTHFSFPPLLNPQAYV